MYCFETTYIWIHVRFCLHEIILNKLIPKSSNCEALPALSFRQVPLPCILFDLFKSDAHPQCGSGSGSRWSPMTRIQNRITVSGAVPVQARVSAGSRPRCRAPADRSPPPQCVVACSRHPTHTTPIIPQTCSTKRLCSCPLIELRS